MTAECLSIKKKELIKTIHTNYFNQSKNERKTKGETIIALETTALRKLSLSELNVFRGSDDKNKEKIRKKMYEFMTSNNTVHDATTNDLCKRGSCV